MAQDYDHEGIELLAERAPSLEIVHLDYHATRNGLLALLRRASQLEVGSASG